jgi:hypothetical protein
MHLDLSKDINDRIALIGEALNVIQKINRKNNLL